MMISNGRRRAVRDRLEQRVSELRQHGVQLVATFALVVGIVAFVFAPELATRHDISSKSDFFNGELAWLIAIVGGYIAFAVAGNRRRSTYFNGFAVFVATVA